MKIWNTKKTTQELIGLGMALHADRDTMETRIRGIFSRTKSTRGAVIAAVALVVVLAFACFTTACRPMMAEKAAADALPALSGTQEGSLLRFDGYCKGTLDGNTITVKDGKGVEHVFTWVDEGTRRYSAPIPDGNYASPGEAALHAAEVAVTITGGSIDAREIHTNIYKDEGMELVYYGIGFDGTPFESAQGCYGYADAATGTLLLLDVNRWGQYGEESNQKIASWDWSDEQYESVHTSEKALATAMALIRTCFPTGEIVPTDPNVWDGGSHTDGEQIGWAGGYEAVVDAYIRMDKDPCYYVQVAVPLEEGAEPFISMFGCYPLGWKYCCNQIHDPGILRQEQEEWEAIRNGTQNTDDGAEKPSSAATVSSLAEYADRAEALVGITFTVSEEDWKKGDSPDEYQKVFLVRMNAYLDDGYEDSDPMLDPKEVEALAERGNVLRFESNGQFSYAVYLGDGQMVYADAETMQICKVSVAQWMNEKTDCTCCILTWK
ncbi:MAG: hypothetical protein IJK54_03005 [Clostridia bacterium]|nr:hypothetical protein [Clostridia bacterium]